MIKWCCKCIYENRGGDLKEHIRVINNVFEYTQYLHELYKYIQSINQSDSRFIFRGHSDIEWQLVPSLLRSEKWKNEYTIIQDCYRRYPDWFKNLDINNNNDFVQILIKLQHYGIPTRLLDFTEDPLIALFFACEQNLDKDGEVFVIKECVNDNTVKIRDSIIEFIKEDINSLSKGNIERLDMNINGNAIIIEPYMNNERIKAQKGLFYLFGMEVNNNLEEKYSAFDIKNKLFLNEIKGDELTRERIVIPAKQKIFILSELDRIYKINKHAVYPELDKYSEYIKDSEQIQEKVNQHKIEQILGEQFREIFDFINFVLSKINKLDKQADIKDEENIKFLHKITDDIIKGSPYRTILEKNNLKQIIICYENLQVFLVYNSEQEPLIVGFKIGENYYFFSELIDELAVEDIIEIEVEETIIRIKKTTNTSEQEYFEQPSNISKSIEIENEIKISKYSDELKENWQEIKSELLAINKSDFKDVKDEIYNILCNYLSFGRRNDIARCNVQIKRYLKKVKPEKYEQLYSQYMSVVEKIFINETA